MNLVRSLWCVILIAGMMIVGSTTADDDYVGNLLVLPADMSLEDVQKTMKEYTRGLGVQCAHCHTPHPEKEGWLDYALDDLETKQVAREMIRMTEAINETLLPTTGRESPIRVGCETCHRGHSRPETLVQFLQRNIQEAGIDSARASYRALRDANYGKAGFDFTESALIEVALAFQISEMKTEAIASALELNLEYYPESFMSYVRLGFTLDDAGDKKGAVENWEKALELKPTTKWLKKQIEKTKAE